MNLIDNDTLQAYVDGELDATTTARIDAALVHDDLLRRRVQQARALRAQLKAAFDPVLDEPVPARLSALLQSARPLQPSMPIKPLAQSAGRRGFGAGRRRTSRRWLLPIAAATASLAVLAATLWWHAGGSVGVHDDRQYAAATLSDALDRALASEPDPHAPISIGLSFRSADGRICRTFINRAKPVAGLACHDDAGWWLPVLSAGREPENGELRQAASAMPPAVQAAVDARIRGEAFDAQQERAARDAGWR
jgi:hypothetical protein